MVVAGVFSCQAQPPNSLSGKYAIKFTSKDLGEVRMLMDFEFKDSTFYAKTREGADRDILGTWTAMLGRLFTDDFKKGSLLRIVKGKTRISGDTIHLSGIFTSAMGNYYFIGRLLDKKLTANLTARNQEDKGKFEGVLSKVELHKTDYSSLIEKVLVVSKQKIFSPSLMKERSWQKFEKQIRNVSMKVEDDLEMVFAFYYADKLPVSHFALLRLPEEESTAGYSIEPQVTLEEKSTETVLMKIKSFSGSAAEIDTVFNSIILKGYKNLIVDLRNNTGGTVEAGMRFAEYLVDSAIYGGVFLTQKWFNETDEIPSLKEYNKFPEFSDANFDKIIEGIHNEKGMCLKIYPFSRGFKGRVYILTNSSTASTCEPIVYAFKQNKRAIIVGTKTAGAMLNGEYFKTDDGFFVIIPTADYYAADGFRIERNGVLPNYEVDPAKALDFVLANHIK
jgi:hypothetical protein